MKTKTWFFPLALTLAGCASPSLPEPAPPETIERLRDDARAPLAQSAFWAPSLEAAPCQRRALAQSFRSGAFTAHRVDLWLDSAAPWTLALETPSVPWDAVALAFDDQGQPIWLGDRSSPHPDVTLSPRAADRDAPPPLLTLQTRRDRWLVVYVTSWTSLLGGLEEPPAGESAYTLTIAQICEVADPDLGADLPSGPDLDPLDMDEIDQEEPDLDPPDLDEPDLDEPDLDEPDLDPPDVDEPDMDEPEAGALALLARDAALGSGASDALVIPARVWRTSANQSACQGRNITEDFSSGRYNVHRWSASWGDQGPVTATLTRTAGAWQPALVVATAQGELIWAGDAAGDAPGFAAAGVSGRGGAQASVTVTPPRGVSVFVYVTSWEALERGLLPGPPTTARYTLSLQQECPPGEGLAALYAGLTLEGAQIPREGVANRTLQNTLGVNPEPHGEVVQYEGLDFVEGLVSWFGGPRDTGVTASETGAITGENLRALNNPLNPDAGTLQANAADYYYVAMRFDYSPQGRSFWQRARFLIVNPSNGVAVVVRAVDWGPHTRTARILDLSPQSLDDLGLETDDAALVAFAPEGAPLGVVTP